MYLDYAKIKSTQREQPVLRLRTLAGKELGPVPFAHNVSFSINYSSLSEINFTVPFYVNGMLNPLYGLLSSYKVIYTDDLGVYVLTSPQKEGDGILETKTVTGYSLEYMFGTKNLFLEEGTYNFWNPADPADTILGRIVELDQTWHIGYVAPRLIGCYRTFDQYDSPALDFCYGDAMKKYRCAFVFDVYDKSINVYDANEDVLTLPIYLNYNNLVEKVRVDEITDEMVTRLHLYGSDGLTIRDVNPIGTDYIVDLSYFLHNGDLDIKVGDSSITLADRVRQWQVEIAEKQQYYTGVVSARASLTAQRLAAESDLLECKGEMDNLTAQQSVIIQAISLETTTLGKNTQQAKMDDINSKIAAKQGEINNQQAKIDSLQQEINGYTEAIESITKALAFSYYFTHDEQKVLNQYLIEGNVEEETFVATDVDTSASGVISKISNGVSITKSDVTRVEISRFTKTMYTLSGGIINIINANISAEIVRGTMEVKSDNSYVMTGYLGNTDYDGHKFDSGLITISGMLSQFSSDIAVKTEQGITEHKGTWISFQAIDDDMYFTVNVSEFQQYSVAMELYDFGTEVLNDSAWPTYEFSVDSANFLYHEKFEPFKNQLELGKAVYLEMGSDGILSTKIIGIELDFEDISKFKLVFSNRYQLKNGKEKWLDEIRNTSRSSRSFDAGKYIYNRAANKITQVDKFMNSTIDAAINSIQAANNLSVVINGAGIQVGGDSKYQMRIVDNMIVMTDDGWKTAKLAIGRFASPETGEQWGLNAELVAGKLIVGNNLILQNPLVDTNGNVTGTMMFQVDATGAWLYNSRIVLQNTGIARSGSGGLMIFDPAYGIVAGPSMLFDTNGTTVTPEFMNELGDITFDKDGMPENANFFLDIRNGNAYFRGNVKATSGHIGGFTIEDDYLHAGNSNSYVAMNGSMSNTNALYAFWTGAERPEYAPFSVKKNGDVVARNGLFSGTVSGALFQDYAGNSMMNSRYQFTADYLDVRGLNVNNRFIVDSEGNVTINGGSISWGAVTGTYEIDKRIANAQETANLAITKVNNLDIPTLPSYIKSTYIDSVEIRSPTVSAGVFNGCRFYAQTDGGYFSFCNSAGGIQGTISYSGSKGIVIGAVDGIYLQPGLGSVMVEDPIYGTSRVVTYKELQAFTPTAVWG